MYCIVKEVDLEKIIRDFITGKTRFNASKKSK